MEETTARATGERKHALLAVAACLRAAAPGAMVERTVDLKGSRLRVGRTRLNTRSFRRTLVIGGGKASALMAARLEKVLGGAITEGRVIVPQAQNALPELSRVRFRRSTHPLPTERGVRAVQWMLGATKGLSADDLVICLISGGGSALMPLPAEGLSVEDKRETTQLLLKSGADIREQNCVRKHLSALKGGRLAEMLYPARVVSLIISDVVGNDLASVASGPTVPDPTTYARAKRILTKRGVWDAVPEQVRLHIQSGLDGMASETPKPGSGVFAKVDNLLIGSNEIPCEAARRELAAMGYAASVVSTVVQGEARVVGKKLAAMAVKAAGKGRPVALVAGGETTVHVTGTGRGGRNQEVALSAAIALAGKSGVVFVSFGTDGVDGPTDAAGALVDAETVSRGRSAGMEAATYLGDNDSNRYFAKLGDLVTTGPTGTNVNDVMIALTRGR